MNTINTPTTIFRALRQLLPDRPLEVHEAQGVAERQALRLLALLDQREAPVDVSRIAELPRIEVRVEPKLPVAGFSQWHRGRWLIAINRDDAPVRRRFTLAHEFKHVLDHPFVDRAYVDRRGKPQPELVEAICDHFAACLLMPRPWVKQAWVAGIQDQQALAARFGVSEAAMAIRLRQLGLVMPATRWNLGRSGSEGAIDPRRYFRKGRPAFAAGPANLVGAVPVVGVAA